MPISLHMLLKLPTPWCRVLQYGCCLLVVAVYLLFAVVVVSDVLVAVFILSPIGQLVFLKDPLLCVPLPFVINGFVQTGPCSMCEAFEHTVHIGNVVVVVQMKVLVCASSVFSGTGVINVLKKDIDPSLLDSCIVNCMSRSIELMCCKIKACLLSFG